MNKRTRNLAVAAALAAGGVGIDRLTAPAAEPEAAASVQTPPAPAPGASAPPAVATDAEPTPAGAPGRLDARLARDGFHAAPSLPGPGDPFFQAAPAVEPPAAEQPALAAPAADIAGFLSRRPLEAVLGQGGRARAVVAGEVLRAGDVRDGMTLESIRGRHVVWRGRGVRFAAGLRAAERIDRGERGAAAQPVVDPVAALFDR